MAIVKAAIEEIVAYGSRLVVEREGFALTGEFHSSDGWYVGRWEKIFGLRDLGKE